MNISPTDQERTLTYSLLYHMARLGHALQTTIPRRLLKCTCVCHLLEFSRLHNSHPWYWNSLIQSYLLWGEFSICALSCSYNQSLKFSFLDPPGTHHCWVDGGDMMWEAYPTLLHMAGSMTRAPVAHPSTTRARHCLTSVIWWELVTTWPCAPMCYCSIGNHSIFYCKTPIIGTLEIFTLFASSKNTRKLQAREKWEVSYMYQSV